MTTSRKESPQTASARPTRYVNRVFAAPGPHTVHVHPTAAQTARTHSHSTLHPPSGCTQPGRTLARFERPHGASSSATSGHEPPSRALLRPSRDPRSTSSTRARAAIDGDGAALDHREAAARSPAALAEEVVGLLRTCEGKGGKQRRSAGRPECGRPRRPHTRGCSSRRRRCRRRCRRALRACGTRRGCCGTPLRCLSTAPNPRSAAARGRELSRE